jgi:hypothetical protein
MTREQAIAWLVDVELSRPDKAAQRTKFYDSYRSYVINYNVGKDLVKDYVEARSAGDMSEEERTRRRWQVYEELVSSPRLPGDLKVAAP